MRILELQELAKDKGFDSLKFKFKTLFGEEKEGQWIDAYFGFFKIDGMEASSMLTVNGWRKEFGDELFEFEVVSD